MADNNAEMARCPLCDTETGFVFNGTIDCDGCGVELKLSEDTLALAIGVPVVLLVPALILLLPTIGRGGVIAIGLIAGQLLPWIIMWRFHKLTPTGKFELNRPPNRRTLVPPHQTDESRRS